MSVSLSAPKYDSQSSDSTVFEADYILIANHNVAALPTKAVGHMHLTIKPDPSTQLWSITNWIDVATAAEPSWSMLKARFSP